MFFLQTVLNQIESNHLFQATRPTEKEKQTGRSRQEQKHNQKHKGQKSIADLSEFDIMF